MVPDITRLIARIAERRSPARRLTCFVRCCWSRQPNPRGSRHRGAAPSWCPQTRNRGRATRFGLDGGDSKKSRHSGHCPLTMPGIGSRLSIGGPCIGFFVLHAAPFDGSVAPVCQPGLVLVPTPVPSMKGPSQAPSRRAKRQTGRKALCRRRISGTLACGVRLSEARGAIGARACGQGPCGAASQEPRRGLIAIASPDGVHAFEKIW